MEKEKPPVFKEIHLEKGTELPILLPELQKKKKGPFSNCVLFVLLAVFVCSLACFAVYTVVSMETSREKNISLIEKEKLTGNFNSDESKLSGNDDKNGQPILNEVKPSFKFSVYVNGKKVISESSDDPKYNKTESIPIPRFPSIADIFNSFNNLEKDITSGINEATQNVEKTEENRTSLSLSPPESEKKPRIIHQTWIIRRIPLRRKDDTVNVFRNPFDDFLNPLLRDPFPERLSQEKKIMVFPLSKKTAPKSLSSEEERKVFPGSSLNKIKPFDSILDDLFDSKPIINNYDKEDSPRLYRKPFVQIIPLRRVNFLATTIRPNSIEVPEKTEKPSMDKYKYDVKSEEDNNFIKKFMGITASPKKSSEEKKKPLSSESNEDSLSKSPLFQNWFDDMWPVLNVKLSPKSPKDDSSKAPVKKSATQEPVQSTTTPEPTTPETKQDSVTSTTAPEVSSEGTTVTSVNNRNPKLILA